MKQKILKTGNSLAVSVPSSLVRLLGLKPGDAVEVKVDHFKGQLICTFAGTGQMSLLNKPKK